MTAWGTWPTDDTFQTGMGTFEAQLNDESFVGDPVGGAAGRGDRGEAVILLPAFVGMDRLVFMYFGFDPAAVRPGVVEEMDCSFNAFDTRTRQVTRLASCPGGRLVFDAAGTDDGEPVRGSFEVTLWGRPSP